MLAKSNPQIRKAVAVVKELSEEEQIRMLAESREKAQWDEYLRMKGAKAEGIAKGKAEGIAEGKAEGIAEGKAEGKAEGIKESQIEIARAMRIEGLDEAIISKTTGLSVEEIHKMG